MTIQCSNTTINDINRTRNQSKLRLSQRNKINEKPPKRQVQERIYKEAEPKEGNLSEVDQSDEPKEGSSEGGPHPRRPGNPHLDRRRRQPLPRSSQLTQPWNWGAERITNELDGEMTGKICSGDLVSRLGIDFGSSPLRPPHASRRKWTETPQKVETLSRFQASVTLLGFYSPQSVVVEQINSSI